MFDSCGRWSIEPLADQFANPGNQGIAVRTLATEGLNNYREE